MDKDIKTRKITFEIENLVSVVAEINEEYFEQAVVAAMTSPGLSSLEKSLKDMKKPKDL